MGQIKNIKLHIVTDIKDKHFSKMYRSSGSKNTIYVGNLPPDVRNRQVEDLFDKYGKIVDVDIKLPRSGGAPAYAFLEFEDSRDAEDAVRGRDGVDVLGQRIKVELHQPKSHAGGASGFRGGGGRGGFTRGRGRGGPPRRSDFRVMVSGLPPTGSWQDIKDHMREAGDVVYSDVFRDGMGIVEYARKDDMEWALKNLDDTKFKSHEGESSFIRVKVDGGVSRRSRSRSPRGRSRSRSRSRSTSSKSPSRTPP